MDPVLKDDLRRRLLKEQALKSIEQVDVQKIQKLTGPLPGRSVQKLNVTETHNTSTTKVTDTARKIDFLPKKANLSKKN